MTVTCPKCEYQRTTEDDDIFPDWQCPKCEIAYNKFKSLEQGIGEAINTKNKAQPKSPSRSNKAFKQNKNLLPTIPKGRKKFIEESLSKDENIEHLFEFNWVVKVPMYISIFLSFIFLCITLLAVVLIGRSQDILMWGFFCTFFIGVATYEYFRLKSLEMGATNKRLIVKTGIVSRHTEEMRIAAIETIELNQGVVDRLLGMGTIKVSGVGVSTLKFSKIDAPLEVKKKIESIRAQFI
ncbi:PH domain-containing protein [Colwellia hornerae]|nr:PH domain-containing protein [Colwellia hornerae]